MKTIKKHTVMLVLGMVVFATACKNNTVKTNEPAVTDSLVQNPNPTVQYDTVKSITDTAHHPDTSTLHRY
jgi:hypothetical protein